MSPRPGWFGAGLRFSVDQRKCERQPRRTDSDPDRTSTAVKSPKKYGGLLPSEMKRLRQLEEENGKLKKIVADLSLDKDMLPNLTRRKL